MSDANDAKPNVLILGATSGIGRALAQQCHGQVILAGRDLVELEKTAADLRLRRGGQVRAIRFDALDFASHPAFFEQCAQAFTGGLDGLFLCYGDMCPQEKAQSDFAAARRVVDTNFTSAMACLNWAANYFEQRKSGFICAISSVAGDRGRQSNYIYGASKAALSTLLQGMRQRLFKAGVRVTTVKPGFVDTAMTWGLPGMFLVATPQRVARDILRAAAKGKPVLYTPWFWWGIMRIIKSIPERMFRKLKL